MLSDVGVSADPAPHGRRLRFSLLTLLAALSVACLILALAILSRRSHIVALIQVPHQSEINRSVEEESHRSAFAGPVQVQAVLRDPEIARLSLVSGQADPAEWVSKHLDVQFAQNSEILAADLIVPARYSTQGQKLLAKLVEQYLNLTTSANLPPSQRTKLIQPPLITTTSW
jgi:hypothetical protein